MRTAVGLTSGRRFALGRQPGASVIGRETQLQQFEAIIDGDNDARTRILLVFGGAGTGKRTVLEMFRSAAIERSNTYCAPVTDLTQPRDLGEMLEEIATGLEAPGDEFDDFTKTLRRYRDKAMGKKPWIAKAAETAESTAVEVNTVAPHWTTGGARIATSVFRDAVDWFEDASSHRTITDEFVNALRTLAAGDGEQAPVILLFNGLDRHPVDPVVRWLRSDLPAQIADVPVTLVFAAENVDSVYDDLRSRGATVERMPLEPFSPAETREFIEKNLGIDPNTRLGRQIAEESGNLPAWLARLQRYFLEHGKPEGDELSEDARASATGGGAELFRRLEDDDQRRLTLYASPVRWFNATLLQSVADVAAIKTAEDAGPQAAVRLIEMSTRPHWIGPRGGGWGFELATQRRALVEELRRVDPEAYWQVHRHAERYHRHRLAMLDVRAEGGFAPEQADQPVAEDIGLPMRRWGRFDDPEYVDALSEWLYHYVALAPDAGFRRLAEEAAEAILHLGEGVVGRLTDIGPEISLGADRMLYLRELAAVDAATSAARYQDAEETLKRLRQMSTPSDVTAASLAVAHGYVLVSAGSPERDALEAFATADRLLDGLPPESQSRAVKGLRALNLTWLSWMISLTEHDERALEHLDSARTLADDVGDERLVTAVIRARALVLAKLGHDHSTEVEPLLEDALQRYRRVGQLKDIASLLRLRAELRLSASMSEQARIDLTDARELSHQLADADGEANTVVALVDLGLRQGDQAGADALCVETIQLRPADPYVRNALGNVYFSAGLYERALDLYTAAVEIQKDMVFFANRGRCLLAMGNREGAVEDMQQAFDRAPSFDLGVELAQQYAVIDGGEKAAAVSDYLVRAIEALVASETEQPAATSQLPSRVSTAARSAIRVLEPAAAQRVLRATAERYPDDLDSHLSLLRLAVETHPEDPELNFTLGRTQQSRVENADESWRKYWLEQASDPLRTAWTLQRERGEAGDLDRRVRYATTYAETMIELRDWAEASDAVGDALAAKPDDTIALELERRLSTLRRRDSYESSSDHDAELRPVNVAVARDVRPLVDPKATGSNELFEQVLPALRDAVTEATGVLIPGVQFYEDASLPDGHVRFLVHGVPKRAIALRGTFLVAWPGHEPQDRAAGTLPWSEEPAVWASESELAELPADGRRVWDRIGVVLASLAAVLITERVEFVGLEQTTGRLQDLGRELPASERVPLAATLRRLVERGVSVADLEPILAAVGDRGNRSPDQLADELAAQLDPVDLSALVERYARGGTAFVARATADIVVRLDGETSCPDGLLGTLEELGGAVAVALGLPRPTVALERTSGLETGQYELAIGEATRVAGSLRAAPKRWLADHPVPGTGGRCAKSAAIDPAKRALTTEVQIARDLEEALWHDPGLLLHSARGRGWQQELLATSSVPPAAAGEAMSVIQELASQRVPLAEETLGEELGRVAWPVPADDADPDARRAPVTKRRELDRAVPDDFVLGLRDAMHIHGAGAAGQIVLSVQLDHPRTTDLRIRLIAPSGVSATVHDRIEQFLDPLRLDSDYDLRLKPLLGEPVAGEWTLSIQDFAAGATGTLVAWALELHVDDASRRAVSSQPAPASVHKPAWPLQCIAVERVATRLRPYQVVVQVASTGVLGVAIEDAKEQLPGLVSAHRVEPGAVGVARGAYDVVVVQDLGQDDYVVVINGLPRARHTASSEDEFGTVLGAVALRVAQCEREASAELLDLTWTRGFLETTAQSLPHLVEAIRHDIPDEIVALTFGCLAEAGIPGRDERLLDAMLDYIGSAPDPASLDARADRWDEARFSPHALVQHTRLALPERVAGSFAGDLPSLAVELDRRLEDRLRTAIAAATADPPVYRIAEAAALLRELGGIVSDHKASSAIAVVTARDLRRHVNSLIGAQFPTVAVIAREEAIKLELVTCARLVGESDSVEDTEIEPRRPSRASGRFRSGAETAATEERAREDSNL